MTDLKACATPYCRRRTRKEYCGLCAERLAKAARTGAKLAALPGTVLNLGPTAFLKTIGIPPGYEAEHFIEDDRYPSLRLTGDGVTIRISLEIVEGLRLLEFYSAGSGHTEFETSKGGRTFDRYGVEDSFYVRFEDTAKEIDVVIAEQLAKVAASRIRADAQVLVPGLPGKWYVTPTSRSTIAAELMNGRSHSFRPAGFGVGYCVYGGRQQTRWSRPLPPETSAFFAIDGPLYYDTLDCD